MEWYLWNISCYQHFLFYPLEWNFTWNGFEYISPPLLFFLPLSPSNDTDSIIHAALCFCRSRQSRKSSMMTPLPCSTWSRSWWRSSTTWLAWYPSYRNWSPMWVTAPFSPVLSLSQQWHGNFWYRNWSPTWVAAPFSPVLCLSQQNPVSDRTHWSSLLLKWHCIVHEWHCIVYEWHCIVHEWHCIVHEWHCIVHEWHCIVHEWHCIVHEWHCIVHEWHCIVHECLCIVHAHFSMWYESLIFGLPVFIGIWMVLCLSWRIWSLMWITDLCHILNH